MTTRGIQHIDVGSQLSRVEWEGVDTHALASGTAFPTVPAPTEMDLFYRTDEHVWYQYDGSDWVDLMSGGATAQQIWEYTTRNLNSDANNTIRDAILDDATRFSGADIADILADTNELQTDWVNGGRLDLLIDAIKAKTDTITTWATQASVDIIDTNVDSILADTGELQTDWVNGGRLDLLIDAIKAKTDTIVASGATEANVDAVEGKVDIIDTNVDSILADTGELQTDWVNGGRLDLLIDAIKAKTDTIVASGALEATLTAIKGGGWTDETLVALMTAIEAITGGATAAQVWAYATRDLTAYHISSGASCAALADAGTMVPTAGYRFTLITTFGQYVYISVYKTSTWVQLFGSSTSTGPYFSYQKVTSGNGAQRLNNGSGGSIDYGYFWENVGASVAKPFVPDPGHVILEQHEAYTITVPEKYLIDNKAKIEADIEDKLGYRQHREVLVARGFKMPEDKDYIIKEK
jgi:hypothetical protein